MSMKYIIFMTPELYKIPIIFPETISHADMAQKMGKSYEVVSAGQFNCSEVYVYGDSITLSKNLNKEIKSLPEDVKLIEHALNSYL